MEILLLKDMENIGNAGQSIEVPDHVGEQFIAAGDAQKALPPPPPTKAPKKAPKADNPKNH